MLSTDDTPPPDSIEDDDAPSAATGDEHLSAAARLVGSDQTMVWAKRITMGLALAFLVGAVGYLIGVRTTVPPTSSVDAGFLQDMSDHHDQAVVLAQDELANGTDPVAKDFAREVLLFQRYELGLLQAYQDERGLADAEYNPDRTTMGWMGMPTPLKDMPGMATDEQLAQLDKAKGVEADKLFLTLMMNHHLGGAHMSEDAAQRAADPKIRELAGRMARNQRIEVKEYQQVLDRLNGK